MIDHELYPVLAKLTQHQLAIWPDHERFLVKSFAGRPSSLLETSERIAGLILPLAGHIDGGLDQLCQDYKFLCTDIVLPEEEFFRRNGRYRLSKFTDALSTVYSNRPFMERYMNGLLLSDIFWSNHACALDAYARTFLPQVTHGGSLLEIGPGHGLLMYFASQQKSLGALTAWDVSETSIAQTQRSLDTMKVERPVTLKLQNLFEARDDEKTMQQFDGVVFSEVLEHLEEPKDALRIIRDILKPGGILWVHVPANSPAPDHLYLISKHEEAAALVQEAGFEVDKQSYFPMSGTTLEKAAKLKLAVSCCIIGRRPS
jgi:2-polyprenyl-3-methyl-5-hydroxy-6-metoxy-1,4-benzoquinol methylase